MVELGSLENCCAFTGTVGSNHLFRHYDFELRILDFWKSAFCLTTKFFTGKGAGVVELAALEML